MSFKARFYLFFFIIIVTSLLAVDQFLGKLYARYMIIFTSTIFLIGMQFGHRSERRWMMRLAEKKKSVILVAQKKGLNIKEGASINAIELDQRQVDTKSRRNQ